MKIAYIGAFVNIKTRLYGNPRWLYETASRINDIDNFETCIISSWSKKKQTQTRNRITIYQIPRKNLIFRLINNIHIIKKIKPDIIHGFGSIITGYLLVILKKIFPEIKVILTFTDFRTRLIFNHYRVLNSLDRIIIMVGYLKEKMLELGVKEELMQTNINLGAEKEFQDSANLKNLDNKITILFYGDAKKYRGIEFILFALKKILNAYTNIRFIVLIRIGDPEYLHVLKNINNKNFEFWQSGNYPISFYKFVKTSDIILLPYEETPICPPTSLIEALAAGKAIISTNVCGIDEIIVNQKNGILVENEKEFYENLCILIENKNLRQALAHQARLTYDQTFSWEKNIQKLVKTYQEIN